MTRTTFRPYVFPVLQAGGRTIYLRQCGKCRQWVHPTDNHRDPWCGRCAKGDKT